MSDEEKQEPEQEEWFVDSGAAKDRPTGSPRKDKSMLWIGIGAVAIIAVFAVVLNAENSAKTESTERKTHDNAAPYGITKCDEFLRAAGEAGSSMEMDRRSTIATACYLSHLVTREQPAETEEETE